MNQKEFMNSGHYLLDEVRSRAEKGSPHFFDKDTLKFFSSRISDLCWKLGENILFITSEADKSSSYQHSGSSRGWTVREINVNGDINKRSKFQEYGSLYQARQAIKEILEEGIKN